MDKVQLRVHLIFPIGTGEQMYNILAFLALLISCYFLLRILRPTGFSESVLIAFCLATACIIIWGYILSALNWLNDVRYWSLLSLITVFVSAMTFVIWNRYAGKASALPRLKLGCLKAVITSVKYWYANDLSRYEKVILLPLIMTVSLLGFLNFLVVVFVAPHQWDSMTYHLARMAYYLQHNNLNYFDANYWAQVLHPKNSSILLIFTYLISGRNENLTQVVQFVSYWVAVCSVYAISVKVGNSKTQSVFAALVSALLITWLMEATTTQNDLILTAYFGASVYFLFAFRGTYQRKFLGLTALGISLSIGTKGSSFLPLLSIALIVAYVLAQFRVKLRFRFFVFAILVKLRPRFRDLAILGVCTLFAVCIFALPAGYLENYHNFGNPIGPAYVRVNHTFEGKPASYIIRNGTKNLIRFGFDFLSLDGLDGTSSESIANRTQTLIRALPAEISRRLGFDLESSEATRNPFVLQKIPIAHEDFSYWGILGFGLVWIVVFLSVLGFIKSADIRILSFAAIIFLVTQAYAGPYDPWRGRYFTTAALFAVPTIGVCLKARNRVVRSYLLFIVLVGCISAVSAVVLRVHTPFISYQDKPSIFHMDRTGQLSVNRPGYHDPLQKFDELVPDDAAVAVYLPGDSFEYPLFGKNLARTIMPIGSFAKGLQPIPTNAEYLLYFNAYPYTNTEDIYLGADWHLRQMTDNNRSRPSFKDCILDFGAGWYPQEPADQTWLRWNNGSGRINITVSDRTDAVLLGEINSIQRPNNVDILLNSRPVATLKTDWEDWAFKPFTPLTLTLTAGSNRLDFVSHNSPITQTTDSRLLAVAIKDLQVLKDDHQPCVIQQ